MGIQNGEKHFWSQLSFHFELELRNIVLNNLQFKISSNKHIWNMTGTAPEVHLTGL